MDEGAGEKRNQGGQNSICKGLEARESLVHLAKLRHSIRLAQTRLPGVMQDGAGEMEADIFLYRMILHQLLSGIRRGRLHRSLSFRTGIIWK